MTAPVLPDRVDPLRLARSGARMAGSVPASVLVMLTDAVAQAHDDVHAELVFGVSDAGVCTLRGTVIASLCLICERCLEPMSHTLRSDIDLVVKAADRAPGGRATGSSGAQPALDVTETSEAWLVDEDGASLFELLEDELLLALPIMAMHPVGQCELPRPTGPVAVSEGTPAPNPFGALKGLLSNSDS